MTMQSPELLLEELNIALRRLRGACTDLANEEIDQKLLEVMRRLLLAEVLGNTWIVAIGGSQGAGKTTLMASMYDLHGDSPRWLQGNPGRGEKLPVLILEENDLKEPQGYIRRLVQDEASQSFALAESKVDVNDFQKATYDPQAGDLLPVLRVPQRYFNRDNQAWLLLPGYEKQDRANRSWQELMRQAMIAAGGCIIVTDETRMANQQQIEIVKDMLKNELKACHPYIVISKTEAHRHNSKRKSELRASAQEIFQISPDLAEKSIILSGCDEPEYMAEWMPLLRDAISDLNFTGQSDRHLQMSHLSEIVGKDLTRVLSTIRSKSRLYFSSDGAGAGDGAQVMEEILEKFDEAVESLRVEHNEKINDLASQAFAKAASELDNKLKDSHEGLKNWVSNAFDTTSEIKKKMQSLVQGSWQRAAPNFFSNYSQSLSTLTMGKLGPLAESDAMAVPTKRLPPEKTQRRIELGYMHASGQPVQFRSLDSEKISDIKILLGNSSKEEEKAHQDTSKKFGVSVNLIPAMALEYSRIFYAMPEALNLKEDFTPSNKSPASNNLVVNGVESLGAGIELGKTAIKSLAGLMAVDVVSDGDSDILGALFGNTHSGNEASGPIPPAGDGTTTIPLPPITLHPYAIAATAAVAAAYLTTVAVTRIRAFEKDANDQAHNMLASVRDHHVQHLRKQFDQTMSVTRARIKEKIRERYKMDEMLMRKDRLAKAIADVTSITSDLRHELGSSATGLQIFATDQNT